MLFISYLPLYLYTNLPTSLSITLPHLSISPPLLHSYYLIYNVIAVLGLTTADYWATLLLLDIVAKNSTAQNVLNSVILPRWNIIMALTITMVMCYIYAFYMFMYFPTDLQDGLYDCETLWGCFKFNADYGIKAGDGVGEEMRHTVGQRWLFDTMFFFTITTGVFNLVAGECVWVSLGGDCFTELGWNLI